jgi:hypothetical protein
VSSVAEEENKRKRAAKRSESGIGINNVSQLSTSGNSSLVTRRN